MNIKNIFSVIAGIVCALGLVPYIWAILRGKTKPAKASWIIWATLNSIVLVGMLSKGAVNGQIISSVIGAWLIFVFALKYGIPGWTFLDKICLGSAVLGVAFWVIFDNAIIGIAASLITMLIGSFPTFASAWEDPSRENRLGWTMSWISCVFAIIAIPKWTFQDAG